MISVKGVDKLIGAFPIGTYKADYGADWSDFTAPTLEGPFGILLVENTDTVGAGIRLYIYANGAYSYVAMTAVA